MKLPTLESLDNPLFFVINITLVMIPILVLVWLGAHKAGVI